MQWSSINAYWLNNRRKWLGGNERNRKVNWKLTNGIWGRAAGPENLIGCYFPQQLSPKGSLGVGHGNNWLDLGQSRLQQDLQIQTQVFLSLKFEFQGIQFNRIWLNCHRDVDSQSWKGHRGSLQKALAVVWFTLSTSPSGGRYTSALTPLVLGTLLAIRDNKFKEMEFNLAQFNNLKYLRT